MLLFFCFFGFYACLFLRESFLLSAIVSSALVGIAGSFLPFDKEIEQIIYCASFAAMSASYSFSETSIILFLPLILYIVFKLFKTSFLGFGGKLGAMAFVSNLIIIFLLEGVDL